MKKFFAKLIRFWSEDRSLTIMFLLLLFFIFVFSPLENETEKEHILLKIFYSSLLLTGMLSVARQKKYRIIVIILAAISLLLNWISIFTPSRTMLLANDFALVLFNLSFAVAILIKTFQPGDITYQRIEGSIIVFLLLGFVFALLFHAMHVYSGASSFNNISGTGLKEFLYYSFTTLTTVGYGDITPVHPLARSLANFEALIGQLYPAILIARLVSMEFESSKKKKEEKVI